MQLRSVLDGHDWKALDVGARSRYFPQTSGVLNASKSLRAAFPLLPAVISIERTFALADPVLGQALNLDGSGTDAKCEFEELGQTSRAISDKELGSLPRRSIKLDSFTAPCVVYAESVAAGRNLSCDRLAVHQPRDLLAIEGRDDLSLLQVI
jgi:hypothetical protein